MVIPLPVTRSRAYPILSPRAMRCLFLSASLAAEMAAVVFEIVVVESGTTIDAIEQAPSQEQQEYAQKIV